MKLDQIKKDPIDYWIDLIQEDIGSYTNVEVVKALVFGLRDKEMLKYFSVDNTGVFAYVISDDFKGGQCLNELMFYIRKECRGNPRLLKRYLDIVEEIARDKNCSCVKIGSNIEYRDITFLELLKNRFGYVDDTVAKYI